MKLNNNVYDFLKWFVMIFLPASGALYFGLSTYWPLPNVEGVVGTTAIAATFLGTLLGISTASYKKSDVGYDGELQVLTDDEQKDVYRFVLHEDLDALVGKDKLNIKVNSDPQ